MKIINDKTMLIIKMKMIAFLYEYIRRLKIVSDISVMSFKSLMWNLLIIWWWFMKWIKYKINEAMNKTIVHL